MTSSLLVLKILPFPSGLSPPLLTPFNTWVNPFSMLSAVSLWIVYGEIDGWMNEGRKEEKEGAEGGNGKNEGLREKKKRVNWYMKGNSGNKGIDGGVLWRSCVFLISWSASLRGNKRLLPLPPSQYTRSPVNSSPPPPPFPPPIASLYATQPWMMNVPHWLTTVTTRLLLLNDQ